MIAFSLLDILFSDKVGGGCLCVCLGLGVVFNRRKGISTLRVCVCVLENDGVDFTNADHDLLVGNSVNYPAGERPPFGESFVDAS
jgi:hypothetical protein